MSFYLRVGGACFLYTHCQALPSPPFHFRRCAASVFAGPLTSGQVPIRRGASSKVLFWHGAGWHPAVVSKHTPPRNYPHSYARFRVTHALRGFIVLTRLAWARCSCGIRHARHGLFAALLTRLAWVRCSYMLCVGSLFSWYLSRPAWSIRSSSHTPCVGSLFSGTGGRSAGHGDREVGLWREIIDCVEKESPD